MFEHIGHREHVVAVVDVGSGSAAAAIMLKHHGKPGTIVAAERAILTLEERSKDQIVKGLGKMISGSIEHVLKSYSSTALGKKAKHPDIVYVIVRAPWTRASSGKGVRIFPKEELVSKTLISELAAEALKGDAALDHSNMLETSVVRVELNEYPTARPIGKKAHRLNVITFESDFDPVMHKTIATAVETALPHAKIVIHSSARAYLSIVEERLDHPSDYVIVDMVSEATSLTAVRGGVITSHTIIDEGVRTILKRVAGDKGMPDETLHLIKMVVGGSCSGEECDKLNAALTRIEPELVKTFGEAVGAFVGRQRLPDHLIIAAHPDITIWLSHLFSRIDFAQFTVSLRPFVVRIMTPEDLFAAAAPIPGLNPDTGISLACAFVNNQIEMNA